MPARTPGHLGRVRSQLVGQALVSIEHRVEGLGRRLTFGREVDRSEPRGFGGGTQRPCRATALSVLPPLDGCRIVIAGSLSFASSRAGGRVRDRVRDEPPRPPKRSPATVGDHGERVVCLESRTTDAASDYGQVLGVDGCPLQVDEAERAHPLARKRQDSRLKRRDNLAKLAPWAQSPGEELPTKGNSEGGAEVLLFGGGAVAVH